MYRDKDLIEHKLYQLIYQFNEIEINTRVFCFVLVENVHPS